MDLMSETWSINPAPIFDSIDMLIAAKSELGFTSNQHSNSPSYFQKYGHFKSIEFAINIPMYLVTLGTK